MGSETMTDRKTDTDQFSRLKISGLKSKHQKSALFILDLYYELFLNFLRDRAMCLRQFGPVQGPKRIEFKNGKFCVHGVKIQNRKFVERIFELLILWAEILSRDNQVADLVLQVSCLPDILQVSYLPDIASKLPT